MPQTTEQTENGELCCKHKIHRKQLKITEIHVGHISVLLLCIWQKFLQKMLICGLKEQKIISTFKTAFSDQHKCWNFAAVLSRFLSYFTSIILA